MRICLVSPPTATEFEDPAIAESEAIRLISERAPVGILTLAAVLEQQGASPQVVDLNRLYYAWLRSPGGLDFCGYAARRLLAESADAIGFGTICSTYPLTIRIAGKIKHARPEIPVLLGGPQASVVDVATLRAFPFVDIVVRGEAEESLPRLLDAMPNPRLLAAIPGITYRRGTEIVRNPNAPVILDLDALPMPAFHLYPGIEACRRLPLELGRGCPFACKFCSTNDFFRRNFRLKSPETVINQMRTLRGLYGRDSFELIHDMFTVDRKRVVAFCEAVIASGERFGWNCSARTDCIDDELIALMARAGCQGIFFGIETGSQRLQTIIDKNLDLREAAARIRSTDRHGIHTTVSLITGFPEETRDDLHDTVGFLMDAVPLDNAKPQLHLLAPLAGTPIHERHREQLTLDDILSDMSCHGWRLDTADRSLIAAYPDIFPNFYAVPNAGLDRNYLRELRDFILHGIVRFRWLLVGLHQAVGVLSVFDLWRARRGSDSSEYYAHIDFRRDFLAFAREWEETRPQWLTPAISTLLACEEALDPTPLRTVSKHRAASDPLPRVAENVRILEVEADYAAVLECLRERRSLSDVPAGKVAIAFRASEGQPTEVLRLSPLSARLLALCDGERSPREIARRLAGHEDLSGFSPRAACRLSLEILREQGLIA
jgi:radical SAM superfamily enzyme YgiQ (UPF0313 family)